MKTVYAEKITRNDKASRHLSNPIKTRNNGYATTSADADSSCLYTAEWDTGHFLGPDQTRPTRSLTRPNTTRTLS